MRWYRLRRAIAQHTEQSKRAAEAGDSLLHTMHTMRAFGAEAR